MVSNLEYNFGLPESFSEGVNKSLFFNSDIKKILLETNGGIDRKPNFVIFLVWSAFIVGGWVVLAWSRDSCLGPAEIASLVFLVLFTDCGPSVNPRFHLFASDVNQVNEEAV